MLHIKRCGAIYLDCSCAFTGDLRKCNHKCISFAGILYVYARKYAETENNTSLDNLRCSKHTFLLNFSALSSMNARANKQTSILVLISPCVFFFHFFEVSPWRSLSFSLARDTLNIPASCTFMLVYTKYPTVCCSENLCNEFLRYRFQMHFIDLIIIIKLK